MLTWRTDIPAKGNFSPRHSIAQIRFGDVDEIRPSSFLGRKFTVKYKNGKKETFLYLKDMRKFKIVLDDIRMVGHQPTPYGVRHHLCPRCTAALPAGEYVCSSCKLEFKNERKARNISILAPGGGYFYTGHPFMGLGDALVESILILAVFMALVNLLMGKGGAEAVTQFIVFGIILFLEKLYTIFHAQHYVKEYIPVDKEFQPLSR